MGEMKDEGENLTSTVVEFGTCRSSCHDSKLYSNLLQHTLSFYCTEWLRERILLYLLEVCYGAVKVRCLLKYMSFTALQLANEQRSAYGLRSHDFTRYR